MPLVDYKAFNGEVPRWAPDLLPTENAQLASNCVFNDGKLTAMKDGLLLRAMVNNPVKGIYTEDGLLFYTWATETLAFKSPIINDTFARVYYLTPSEGILRVTTTAGMAVDGPSPGTSHYVGVPKPTVAPVLKTVDRTTLPDYPNTTISATAWWDYNGTKYSEGAVALSVVTALRQYGFTAPALPVDAPEGVTPVLCVRFKIADNNNGGALVLDVTVRSSSATRSSALPGGVEVSMVVASTGDSGIFLLWSPMGASAYTYTYQNTWNEEGAPAPPAVISPTYIQDVQITPTAGDFTNYRPFQGYKFYRTYGAASTYVLTDVTGAGPYVDSSRNPTSVGVALESTDWFPPVTGLAGATMMPGGWFVTFKGNTLYKHAPNRPHAVPYTETFPTNIRGISKGRMGLVVTTADDAYIVSGAAPNQAGYISLSVRQPGVAQRSMQEIDGAVLYASNDGIVMVDGSIASMDASQKLFTRPRWRELYGDILLDASMRFATHDTMLVASSSTQSKGFILKLDENAGSYSRIAQRMDATFMLPITDALYYSVGANVYQFQAGAALNFDWWSKDFVFTYPVSFGAGYIKCTGSVTLQVYVDDVLWRTRVLTSGYFRIKPRRGMKWSFRLTGSGAVQILQLAQGMSELKRV